MNGRAEEGNPWQVSVEAPCRLHMGFLDLHGGCGRRFASLGLALSTFVTRVVAAPAAQLEAEGPDAVRALRCARRVCTQWGIAPRARLRVERAIPPHAGLGSGSQLALVVGTALTRLHGMDAGPQEIATICERGLRSGVGIGAFERGGFLVDGGRGAGDGPPPVLVRMPLPAQWRVLLVLDEGHGLHDEHEARAFERLPRFPAEQAAELCRLALMQLLPALVEGDLERFGAAVAEVQRRVGDHFAPVQGGRFASPRVAEALEWMSGRGAVGMGQSSWGPTGFCLIEGAERANALGRAATERFGAHGLRVHVARGRNHGAVVGTPATEGAAAREPAC